MSKKFHINGKGVPAKCYAKNDNCPFGGTNSHYDNEEDAQIAIDNKNQKEFGIAPGINEIVIDPFSSETLKTEFPELSEYKLQMLKDYYDLEMATFELTSELEKSSDEYKASDEYFDKVQRLKIIALSKYDSRKLALEFANDDLGEYEQKVDDYLDPHVPKPKVFAPKDPNKKSTYNFHPEINHSNFHNGIGPVISAYSGKHIDQVKKEIDELRELNNDEMSLQEATRVYWNSLKQRTDKPIVCIDLETANPRDRSLAYDGGQLTYIIETGAIKIYPDGRTEKLEFMSGIPEKFNEHHSTGFVETHGIEYKDIDDEKEFVKNEQGQKAVLDFLDNSVMMAHNANFEIKQFTNSLKGFKGKLNEGNIEVLDTMNFSKYLVPESARNTNEAFVEAAGLDYSGAHRAYQDAKMSLNAFLNLKDNR